MTRSMLKILATSSVIALLSISVKAEIVDEIEKTFDVSENASFRLDNVNGSVSISAWDKSIIKVTAIITADSQDDRDNIVIDMQHSSDNVSIETRYKERFSWGRNSEGNSSKVEYSIIVPKNSTLSEVDLVNGSLSIKNVQGEVNASSVNGSIKASGLASNSELTTVNGSIKVSYSELAEDLDRIELETVNGSIKLSVPKTLSASVNAETTHGSIKTDFGLVAEKSLLNGSYLSGNIGRGDIRITMKSVNGSVKLISD